MDRKPRDPDDLAPGLKHFQGEIVLDHEGGNRFYHKHLSPKAKAHKRKARKQAKQARRRNR